MDMVREGKGNAEQGWEGEVVGDGWVYGGEMNGAGRA